MTSMLFALTTPREVRDRALGETKVTRAGSIRQSKRNASPENPQHWKVEDV